MTMLKKSGDQNAEPQYKITDNVMFTLSTGGQNVLMQQSGKGIWHNDGDKKLWYQTRNKNDDNDENYYVKTKEGDDYIYFIKTSFPDSNNFDNKYYKFDTNGYVTKWGKTVNELEDY